MSGVERVVKEERKVWVVWRRVDGMVGRGVELDGIVWLGVFNGKRGVV